MSICNKSSDAMYLGRHHNLVVLEMLVCRRITNDEFEDRWVLNDYDPALEALRNQVDNCYNDGDKWFPKLASLHYYERRKLLMITWFLLTEEPYEWPKMPDWYEFSLWGRIFNRKKVDVLFESQWAEFRSKGDVRYWPFLKKPDVLSFLGKRHRGYVVDGV